MKSKSLTFVLVLSLAVLAFASVEAAVSKENQAPQWEYKIVAMKHYHVGRDVESHTSMLNQLGSQGWELIPVDGLTWTPNKKALVFKRPLSP